MMKESNSKFYNSYKPFSMSLKLGLASLLTKNKLRKLALRNQLNDYLKLNQHPQLLNLHKRLNQLLSEGKEKWESYDYGEGYFYQSLKSIQITGFRNTEERFEAMGLKDMIKGKSVLEIGCNTGFLSFLISKEAKNVVAFDIAPHLVAIAQEVQNYLDIKNIAFSVESFENFFMDEQFDFVLSFANHSTYDGNTQQTLKNYFHKCAHYLKDAGLFLFESHPEAYEGKKLEKSLEINNDYFVIKDQKILQYGTFLDRTRTFIVAEKRKN